MTQQEPKTDSIALLTDAENVAYIRFENIPGPKHLNAGILNLHRWPELINDETRLETYILIPIDDNKPEFFERHRVYEPTLIGYRSFVVSHVAPVTRWSESKGRYEVVDYKYYDEFGFEFDPDTTYYTRSEAITEAIGIWLDWFVTGGRNLYRRIKKSFYRTDK